MYILILTNFILIYVFSKTLSAIKLDYKEFLKTQYLVYYAMLLYLFFFYKSYLYFPFLFLSIIVTLKVIESHPMYRFPLEDSNQMLIIFGLLNCNIVFNILKLSFIILSSII